MIDAERIAAQENESQALAQPVWHRAVKRIDWSTRRLGTIVPGVNIENLTDEMFEEIAAGFLTHSVIVIKNQTHSPEKQVEFSKRFGALKLTLHSEYALKDLPPLSLVSNVLDDGKRIGHMANENGWHADGSPFERPSGMIMLHARELPPFGGDTLFSDMYAAYDALPADRKRELEGMKAIHRYIYRYDDSSKENAQKRAEGTVHPLVRTHFQTGRRALFTGDEGTGTALNMASEQVAAFMRDLIDFATKPEFLYRHRWELGDLVIWDNRVLLHKATPFDMVKHRRLLHRTTTYGERPELIA